MRAPGGAASTATDVATCNIGPAILIAVTSTIQRRACHATPTDARRANELASRMFASDSQTQRFGRSTGSSAEPSTEQSSGDGSRSTRPSTPTSPDFPGRTPSPPTAEEAARLVDRRLVKRAGLGCVVWLTMTTGVRRGEVCGLRWSHVDLDHAMITIRRTVYLDEHGQLQEKDTKTHQQRRVVLDPETAAVLREHRLSAESRAAAVDRRCCRPATSSLAIPRAALP